AVLAWVKLLDATRFGPERGILDPENYVSACLGHGAMRPGVQVAIRHAPALSVTIFPSGALTDVERCVEAVLGATAWPSTRPFTFELSGGSSAAQADVSFYFSPATPVSPVDPQRVRDAMQKAQSRVAICWESALQRRAGLAGGRTVLISIDGDGAAKDVSIVGNASDTPLTAADYLLDQCLVGAARDVRFGGGAPGDAAYSWV